jgi:integrase
MWFDESENPQPKAVVPSEADSLLADAIQKYLHNIAALKSWKTANGYSRTLDQFKAACTKTKLKDVRVQDLRDFVVYLKKDNLCDRTISNRLVEVVTFLRANDIKDVTLRHKYTEKIVKAYHPDDLKLLFCACQPEEWLLFQFFFCTGAREQEVMHACWQDVDFKDGVFTIRDHPEWGFTTKDHEEREIPLPTHLVEKLKARVRTSELIFPTATGRPDGHFLRRLKEIAVRAGVDPDQVGLHKWRKTFATLQHENGVSARTIRSRQQAGERIVGGGTRAPKSGVVILVDADLPENPDRPNCCERRRRIEPRCGFHGHALTLSSVAFLFPDTVDEIEAVKAL